MQFSYNVVRAFVTGAMALFMLLTGVQSAVGQGTAFIVNRVSTNGTIAVVNADTYVAEGEILVGDRPTSLASTRDGKSLYVTVTDGNVLSVISVANRTVVETIPALGSPWGITMTPNGEFAYVSDVFEAVLGVLRLSDNTFIQTITSPFFDTPQGMAITPDGSYLYVANVAFRDNPVYGDRPENITVVNTETNTVVTGIDVSDQVEQFGPWDVTMLPDGKKAYSNDGDNGTHIFEIDTDPLSPTFNEVIGEILLGTFNGPRGMESGVTPRGVRVYAGLAESDEVVVIDPATNAIVARIPTGVNSYPWRVRLNPDGTELWVSLRDTDEVLVLSTATNAEITRITGFNRPADIAFPVPALEVAIDIKPGSDPNCFNQNEHGVLPVAILGSSVVDVNDIVIESLSLQGLAVKVAGKSENYLAHFSYVNDDAYLDLVVQFLDSDAWMEPGNDSAVLTGELTDGRLIEGTDTICIVP